MNNSPAADAYETEINDLRRKREAIEQARAQREQESEGAERLAAERMALADAEAIEAAERDHGGARRIAVLRTEMGAVIVKRAHAATFRRFLDVGKTDTETLEKLVRACLVYPVLSEFERICNDLPLTLVRAADAVSKLAGIRAEDVAGKS